jgi:4-hydroxybenzoate polyprenyltransferase
MKDIIKKLFKADQLLVILSYGYLGLLFAGKSGIDVWLLVTVAFVTGKIAHLSFSAIRTDITVIRDRVNPEDRKKNYKLWISGILSSAIFIFSSFLINPLCYYFSIASVIAMILIIVLKKYGSLPAINIGLFEALCPLGGFVAADNRFALIAFILMFAVLLRNTGLGLVNILFKTQNDKTKTNYFIKRYGMNKIQIFSLVFFYISASLLILAGIFTVRGLAYWIAVLCCVIIIIRQTALLSNRDTDTAKNEFIQINNLFAPLILIGTIIDIFFH